MLFYRKPLNYAIALNELGSDVVHRYVGQEPSGGKFNALELDYNSEIIVFHLSIAMGNDGFFLIPFSQRSRTTPWSTRAPSWLARSFRPW